MIQQRLNFYPLHFINPATGMIGHTHESFAEDDEAAIRFAEVWAEDAPMELRSRSALVKRWGRSSKGDLRLRFLTAKEDREKVCPRAKLNGRNRSKAATPLMSGTGGKRAVRTCSVSEYVCAWIRRPFVGGQADKPSTSAPNRDTRIIGVSNMPSCCFHLAIHACFWWGPGPMLKRLHCS